MNDAFESFDSYNEMMKKNFAHMPSRRISSDVNCIIDEITWRNKIKQKFNSEDDSEVNLPSSNETNEYAVGVNDEIMSVVHIFGFWMKLNVTLRLEVSFVVVIFIQTDQ